MAITTYQVNANIRIYIKTRLQVAHYEPSHTQSTIEEGKFIKTSTNFAESSHLQSPLGIKSPNHTSFQHKVFQGTHHNSPYQTSSTSMINQRTSMQLPKKFHFKCMYQLMIQLSCNLQFSYPSSRNLNH